jgi:archaellum component FlaF (FlaF/FlaG flagellin family)
VRLVKLSLPATILLATSLFSLPVSAQTSSEIAYGPYSALVLVDGTGLEKPLTPQDVLLDPGSPATIYAWVRTDEALAGHTLIAGIGDPAQQGSRYFATESGHLLLSLGARHTIASSATLTPGAWHLLAATFADGQAHLYSDGQEVAKGAAPSSSLAPVIELAPNTAPWDDAHHFGGRIANLTVVRRALAPDEIKTLAATAGNLDRIDFEDTTAHWPLQSRGQAGYSAPQDPATLPRSLAPYGKPVAEPAPTPTSGLVPAGPDQWTIAGNWQLAEQPKVSGTGAELSAATFKPQGWMQAVVPGTVLTTMVARGIYPDPSYGLNNMTIPESLNKQSYWYRTEFPTPAAQGGRRMTLTFHGINYAAQVWLNGKRLGNIKGAFIRGQFDVTALLRTGQTNTLAVLVAPPTHPGIPQEQSIKGGPGENGGIMVIDGPTFMATEGWDWIPGVRDRNTGIWQSVTLESDGPVKLGDAQVITSLPHHDATEADLTLNIPLVNTSSKAVRGELQASFDAAVIHKQVTAEPGESTVSFTPAEFAQLKVQHPGLWWPNGYGKPELHHLKLTFGAGHSASTKEIRFGMREITYELSLMDSTGHLRRVEVSPTTAKLRNETVVDGTHEGIRKTPESWVSSLYPGMENSPAVTPLTDTRTAPYLVLKVNGVRIAAKGGNWGMDDFMKRVSREKLEPYFRLHRDAHLNIIRNWVGQNTEEVFYDLADEYGLLIWNDFWASTQNYNLEPEDPALFLANAKDVMLRFRNHPSIAVWCGRNEGVPQPILNKGLQDLANAVDGTRYYTGSSNQVNLQTSGPYSYKEPSKFFTVLNHGFSVEMGTPSMSTLESFESTTPKADQWPVNDTWAYHDWHQSGNGDVAPFTNELTAEFGAATSLPDFERKAQMMNYVDHRAIFEGMNAHLWAPNSGRMLWMTQPAWPSTMWQIFSSDYDTQASFYGVKSGAEPIHVQMNLPDFHAAVTNNTTQPLTGLTLHAHAVSLDGTVVFDHTETLDAPAVATTTSFAIEIDKAIVSKVVLVELQLKDATGAVLSRNFYWQAADATIYRQLSALNNADVAITAVSAHDATETHIDVTLKNQGTVPALESKLTLLHAGDHSRILPAYYSDNYISLLPGEERTIRIDYPSTAATGDAALALRGWNIPVSSSAVQSK